MFKMDLPEDLTVTGPELQDQKILPSNHRLIFPIFYTLLPSNPWQSLATTDRAPKTTLSPWRDLETGSTEHNTNGMENFRAAHYIFLPLKLFHP